ncbi:hypothetical protein [Rhodococcus qingshengii]|uniref:hypothetical protein n=1 Tax=Rhodococcus qingshengii TaxID=334542 RepID=UPI0027DF56BE|nr:hypothetical protein [Rhodococcus qingshengii]
MNWSPGCGLALDASQMPFTVTESPTVICWSFFPSTWTSVIFTSMPGLTPRAASRCAATGVVDEDAVVIGGFAEVGDSDVEVGGAVVFSGASVVVAGGFGVVGTIVVGTMVVEVPTSSAEATWTKENDDTTSARTATIIPKAAHRDTTPSLARRGKTRLRMTNTFRSEHMI